METEKSERTIRIQEAAVDTTFITILAVMFWASSESTGIAVAFCLSLVLAASIVLYRAFTFEADEDEADVA